MPSTLLIAGKKPVSPIVAPKTDRLTPMLESFNRLFYDGGRLLTMRNELAQLDRKCASRLTKLDDPALRDHPGYEQAFDEWCQWSADAVYLNADVKVLTAELQQESVTIDALFQAMSATEQSGVLDLVSLWFSQTTELVKLWPEIRALKGWKTLLRAWGSRYEVVPF